MGTSERKQRERARREKEIIDKARELFIQNGYEATTIDQIAEALEISKGAIYLHFSGKEELYFRIVRDGLETMYDYFLEATASETIGLYRFAAIGVAYIRFREEQPEYRQLLNQPISWTRTGEPGPERRAAEDAGQKLFQLSVSAIQQGMEDGSFRRDINPVLAAFLVTTATQGILQGLEDQPVLLGSLGMRVEDFQDAVMDFLVGPIQNPECEKPFSMSEWIKQKVKETNDQDPKRKSVKKKVKNVMMTNGADKKGGAGGPADPEPGASP